jgi:hypothetical protein
MWVAKLWRIALLSGTVVCILSLILAKGLGTASVAEQQYFHYFNTGQWTKSTKAEDDKWT